MKKITLNDFEENHAKKLKSWRFCLAFLFGMLFVGGSSFAQTIQIGSGTATGSYLPLYYLYDKNYTQTIYTSAEMTNAGATATGGIITKVRFKPTASVSTVDWRNWTIYLDNTTKTSFTSTADWIPIADFTQVFSGLIQENTVANNWIEITLTTPFTWDGTNIAIAITETTPDWGNSPNWASYTLAPATGSKAIYKYQDGGDISTTSPPTGTLSNIVAQIQFDGTLQAACAGTPVGGTAALSPASGNSGSSFSASSSGTTSGSGLTYQWQKEIAGTWQNIAGATSKTSVITAETGAIGTVTNYRLAVTCTASAETTYSTPTAFTIALAYCVPTGGGNNADEFVNFTLNNLNNTSAPSEGVAGYSNYAGTVAPALLQLGVPYIATITGGTGSGTHGAAIWIDYNKNGTFETTEKVTFIGNTIGASATASFPEFIVPEGTSLGIRRMRVQHQYSKSGDLLDPCVLSSTLAETEDYNVDILPVPTCLQPSGATALNITSSSANLTWTSTGTSFQLEWGLQGFVQGTGTTVNVTDATTYALSGLAANTSYSYYIRRNCGTTDGFSLWTGPTKFKTACGSLTTFFENFDSSIAGSTAPMPSCWSRAGNGSTYVTTGSLAPNTPVNRLYMFASNTAVPATEAYAIMPAVSNLQAGTHRLKFKAYASALSKTMEVGYFTELTDLSSFVVIETVNLPGTAQTNTLEFVIEPTGIAAGVTNLVFRNNAPTGGVTIYIDDVTWEPLPACPDITTIALQTFNSSTATISWEPGGSESAWEYVYGPAATTTSPAGLTPVPVSNDPVLSLSGLTANTAYKVYIRSICSSGVGNWPQTPFTFATSCATVTAFSESFDTYTLTGSTNPLPNCWTRFGNTANTYITTGSTAPMSPANRLYLSASATGTSLDAIAVMPPVSNLQAGTHRLKFKAFATTAGKSIELGYFDNSGDPSSFVVLEAFELPGTVVANTQDFNYTPASIPDGVESLVFRNHGPAFTGTTTMYVDNVVWEPLPACFDITQITLSNITSTTADVEWNAGGSETAWQYVIAPSTVTSPVGLTPIAVSNSPYIALTGLTPSTSYNLWILSDCGNGALGNYSTAKNFLTACAPITALPWNEGFEGVTTVGTTAFPPCWLKENGDWSTALTGTYNTPRTGTKYLRDAWSATNEYMWTPGFELTANTSYDFSFYMQGDGYTGWSIDVFQNTSQISTNATQIGNTATPSGTGSTAIQPYQLVNNTFVPSTSGVYYFAIRVNQPSGSPWYVAFDDFNLKASPNCVAPSTSGATDITTTSATINWTAPFSAPANGYEYFVTTSTDMPTSATTPTGSTAAGITSMNLINLTSSSVYKFYVRGLCSASEKSEWSQAGTFTTLCNTAPLPYLINFESVSVPNLPLCTSNQNVGSGNAWVTATASGNGFTGKVLKYNYNGTNAANTWFFTNNVSLTAGTQYTISYKYGNDSTTYAEKLKVAYGTSADNTAMTTVLADHPNVVGGILQNSVVTFTPAATGTYVFGFQAYSIADQLGLLVDDIMIQEVLSNGSFENNRFTAYPNPVKNNLTIRYNKSIDTVTIFNLLGQQLFSRSINATEGKVDMSSLTAGTYLVKVASGDQIQTLKVIKE